MPVDHARTLSSPEPSSLVFLAALGLLNSLRSSCTLPSASQALTVLTVLVSISGKCDERAENSSKAVVHHSSGRVRSGGVIYPCLLFEIRAGQRVCTYFPHSTVGASRAITGSAHHSRMISPVQTSAGQLRPSNSPYMDCSHQHLAPTADLTRFTRLPDPLNLKHYVNGACFLTWPWARELSGQQMFAGNIYMHSKGGGKVIMCTCRACPEVATINYTFSH
jgi:hypothetical protein